jgi:hypothetical protein
MSNADLSRAYSWRHKLYIDTLLYDNTFISNKIKTYQKIEFAEIVFLRESDKRF